jgi:phosphotransferase system enzyme I (PtsP)
MQYGETVLVLRRLLARIRDVMASEGKAERRLARIVGIIASDMNCEVCSIYVRRAGDVLELFATQGLNQAAVRRTRLRVGEGLIGEIAAKARPLALAHARQHPSFVYRPETGEEAYQSLMGVPILRGGRVVGVLAVQNVRSREYTDEEIEALQTVAMVLAELVAGGELIARDELSPVEAIGVMPLRLDGVRLNAGIGLGVARLHKGRVAIRNLVAEDTAHEQERLRRAVADMHGAIDSMLKESVFEGPGEHREVLETYRMIAEDVGWLRRIADAINTGLTAEAAVQKVNDDIHARFAKLADPYLRERVHDLEDLATRLQQHLLGADGAEATHLWDEDFVLVARNLGPAQLLDYHRSRLKAVLLEEGAPHSHVAIVARALDIPVLGQVRDVLNRIEDGDPVIVDADHGQAFIRPSEDIKHIYRRSLAANQARRARYVALHHLPATTKDGVRISLNVNAGLLVDLQHFTDLGADGVGLYRTEVPFMMRSDLPDIESQRQLYEAVLDAVHGKPVVFRTLDIGGDKVLPYWDHQPEENPAMGWRAIRVALHRPAMLRQQLQALVQASAGRELSVMFPMITTCEEFRFARRLLDQALEHERRRGRPLPERIRMGAMLEVPALLYQLDRLLAETDFLSIGTNDLFQFLFASDRGSYQVSQLYDLLSPVPLRVLRDVVEACWRHNVELSLCGEMAAQALDAMALLGLGLRNLSVAPPAVGPIKEMIRSLELAPLEHFIARLAEGDQRSVRPLLLAYARDHEIAV